MKKTLIFFLALSATFSTIAQGLKIGIQFTPHVSYNRIKDQVEDFSVTRDGAGFRFTAGPVVDWYLMENVAISSGVWFSNKRAGVNFVDDSTGSNKKPEYTLHYMQIPLSIKMFVNEIAGTWKPYIQVGGTLEFKVSEKLGNDVATAFEEAKNQGFAKFYDFGLFIGIGTEMKIFNSNSVFAAITYQRGLLNIMKGNYQKELAKYVSEGVTSIQKDDELKYKNHSVGLMLGFKF